MISKLPQRALVSIIMGSRSDWDTMQHAVDVLEQLGIPYEREVVSAHRTPDKLFSYAEAVAARGIEVIIAGAGGAAHLPGMCAAKTQLPVIGVPVAKEESMLRGLDALLSIVQMPGGIPVATMSIGIPGAINGALFAAAILANKYPIVMDALTVYRQKQTQAVLDTANNWMTS